MTEYSQGIVGKIRRGMSRDRNLPLAERLRKGVNLVTGTLSARVALRSCDRVGEGARATGRIRVVNRGAIEIGRAFVGFGDYVPLELLTGENGRIEIGDDVWINFGTVLSAQQSIKIGDRSQFGQHCIVTDTDGPGDGRGPSEARPIEIGNDVWVAGRVTVRPGVKIGDGSVITAGSVVESDVPPGVIAGGIPARVLRPVNANEAVNANTTPAAATSAKKTDNGAKTEAAILPEAPIAASGTLISDFTIDELADSLRGPGVHPPLAAHVAPFGQVTQVLLNPPPEGYADFAVIWVRPDTTVPSFARVLAFEEVAEEALLAEVDAFTALVERAATGYKTVFVPSWVLPPWTRGLGMMDARKGGITRTLLALNLRLADNLAKTSNVFVLGASAWFEGAGSAASRSKAWYLGKMAASPGVFREAAADIRAAFAGARGGARKLLVLDLDDTMWGGIVGDVGWENLRIGGLDGEGEAYQDFQRAVKHLQRRGVILGIVSKNEESVALEAIRRHPEMVLREEDFVGWRINWSDKAKNIADLTAQLNLGLQSVVFIDDNPVERARVRETLPEVLVPEWPEDRFLYPVALQQLRCFDTPALSEEDLARTRLYQEERQREQLQQEVGSIDDWLKSLDIRVKAERLSSANITRATQLLNKTNQLNLTTRRLSEAELLAWANEGNHALWAVSVADRFGDAGLTGLVSVEFEGGGARIVDYVLSCRVMGRKVEETMVHIAVTAAQERAARVEARYLKTPKNKPCFSFWKSSGFESDEDDVFSWNTSTPYLLPEPITLDWQR